MAADSHISYEISKDLLAFMLHYLSLLRFDPILRDSDSLLHANIQDSDAIHANFPPAAARRLSRLPTCHLGEAPTTRK